MTCIATPLPVQGWAFGSVLATALPLLRPHGPSIAGGGPVCSVSLLRLRLLAGKLWQPACASPLMEFLLSDRVLVMPCADYSPTQGLRAQAAAGAGVAAGRPPHVQ